MTIILTAAEREQLQSRPALTIKRDHGHAPKAGERTLDRKLSEIQSALPSEHFALMAPNGKTCIVASVQGLPCMQQAAALMPGVDFSDMVAAPVLVRLAAITQPAPSVRPAPSLRPYQARGIDEVTMRGNPVRQLVGRVIRRSNDKPLRSELLILTREQADWIDGVMWAQRNQNHIAGLWFEAGRHRFDVEWKLPGGPVVVVRQGIEGFAPFSEHHDSPMAFAKAYGLDEDSGPQNDVQAAAGGLTQKPVEY